MRLPSLSAGLLVFLLTSILFISAEARLGPRSRQEADGTAIDMSSRFSQRRRMLEEQGASSEEQKKQDEKAQSEVTGSPAERKKDEPKLEVRKEETKPDDKKPEDSEVAVAVAADDQKKEESKVDEKNWDEKKDETKAEEKKEVTSDASSSSDDSKGEELKEINKREEQLLNEALVLEKEESRVQDEKNEQSNEEGEHKQDFVEEASDFKAEGKEQKTEQRQQQTDVKMETNAEEEEKKEDAQVEEKKEESKADEKEEPVKVEIKAQEKKEEPVKVEIKAEEKQEEPVKEEEKKEEKDEVKQSSPAEEKREEKKDEPLVQETKVEDDKSSEPNEVMKVNERVDTDEKETKEEEKQEESTSVETMTGADTADTVDADDDYPDFLDELLRFPERLSTTAEHLKTNVPGWDRLSTNSKDLFNQANEQIKESFTPLIGRDYAPVVAYLVSYGLLLLPLGLVMFLFERIRAIFSLQKVLLFINIYVAAYFAALVAAAFILGSEPMDFFRNFSPSSYIFLQLLQAFGYIMFIILQTFDLITTCSSGRIAAKLSAMLQWIVVVAVGFHYYVTVFHRAMAKAKPLTSWKIYGLYSISFTILCAFARIERGKKQYIIQESGQETTKQN